MVFLELLIHATLASSISLMDSVIITSSITPEPLKLLCTELNMIRIDNESSESVAFLLSKLDFLFLVDFTYSQSFTSTINSISEHFQVPYLSIFKYTTECSYRVEVHSDINSEAEGILSLLSALKLTSFTILTSSNLRDLDLAIYLKALTKNDFFAYSDNITEEFANNFVLKILKSSGVNTVVLIDSSESFSKIEKALINKRWMKNGSIIIYSARTPSQLKTIGTLQVCESGAEGFTSDYEFHFKAVSNFAQDMSLKLEKTIKSGELTRSVLLQNANKYNRELNIVNFQPDVKIVGNFKKENSQINLTSNIIFPGNTTDFMVSTKAHIALSIANGTNNPYFSSTYTYLAYLFQGASYAVYRSNLFNEIPNFELILSPNDCGVLWYDPFWYQNCFSRILKDMGVGFITSFFGNAIKGNIYTLRILNNIIPQVSPLGTHDDLESTENFPELVKLETNSRLYISSQYLTLVNLGYKDVVIIAANDTLHIGRYLNIKGLIEDSGMRIVNDENTRFIDYDYTRENFTLFEDLFRRIKDTRCTVLVVLTPKLGMILEALHDVGFRKGDLVYVTYDTNAINILKDIEEPYLTKRKELIIGTLLTSYREWIGDFGEKLLKELSEKYNEVGYMCMTYDTVSVFKEAIKYVLSIGEDIESYPILMKAIRMNRFTGCLGNVFFSNALNSRSSAQILIQQLYFNESIQVLMTEDVAYYDRFGAQLFTQIGEFKWPNGEKPPNYRPISECGYEPREEENSIEGKKVLYIICTVIFVVSIISGLVCIYYYKEEFEELKERKIISLGDMIFYAYFILEFFQIITMGPDQDANKQFFGNQIIFLSFELNEFFSFKLNKFWMLFYGIFSLSLICVFILTLKITKLESLIPSKIKDKYQFLANSLMLIFCHLLFLPTVSMLLNIFSCYRATGTSLSDSFLEQDCKTNCYVGTHKIFAVLTGLLLLFFVFLTTLYRPRIQNLNQNQNAKTNSKFLVFQTWFQLAFVILNKTLKIENQMAHGIVFIIILLSYLIGTYAMQPYNFRRPLVGHCFFIKGIIWAVLTSVLFREVGNKTVWIVIEFVGFGFLMVLGMAFFKNQPEVLYSVKGKDISTLFLFQFFRKYEKYVITFQNNDNARETKYKIEENQE